MSMPERLRSRSRIAIPVFMDRVSPVLDTCTQIILVDVERNHEICRTQIGVTGTTLFERASFFKMIGVQTIICSAISDSLHRILRDANIEVVCGVAGVAEEIIKACISDSLHQNKFQMPGSTSSD
jgi:predicted Fe-Mo cluster-binding NifX family protein